MDFFSKRRFIILTFSILVVLNLFLLGVLWQTHLRRPFPPPPPPNQRPKGTAEFLEKELNLSKEQRRQFEEIKAEHFDRSNSVRKEIHRLKQEILKEAFSDSPDTLKVRRLARQIGEKETEFEEFLFQHFSELKSVCTPGQLEELKKIFDEILERNRPPELPMRKPPPPGH
jgi:Spy/CpxP family protein refolding chaperone